MSTSRPQKLFGTTNELAKERNRAASERTMNAWVGNCLSLIGIGAAIDQIFYSLRRQFPDINPLLTETVANVTSLIFIGTGLGLLIIALIQHRLVIKSVEREDYVWLSVNDLNRVAVAGVLVTGFLGLFATIFLL